MPGVIAGQLDPLPLAQPRNRRTARMIGFLRVRVVMLGIEEFIPGEAGRPPCPPVGRRASAAVSSPIVPPSLPPPSDDAMDRSHDGIHLSHLVHEPGECPGRQARRDETGPAAFLAGGPGGPPSQDGQRRNSSRSSKASSAMMGSRIRPEDSGRPIDDIVPVKDGRQGVAGRAGRGDNPGMLRSSRYCTRCQTQTEHIRDRRPFLWGWRRLWAYPFALIADLWRNRWQCTVCLRHDRVRPRRRHP